MSLNTMDENSDECVSKVRFVPKGNGLITHFERLHDAPIQSVVLPVARNLTWAQ
jgi:hypothetical protein